MTQSGPHRPCIVYGSAKPQLGVCVRIRSVEEQNGEAGLHPSVHQTALDSSLWTKSACVRFLRRCVSLIRASGLLCLREIKEAKWNLKTERTLSRPESLDRKGKWSIGGKKENKRKSQVLVETFTAFLWSIERQGTRGFLFRTSGLNTC